MSIMYSDNLEMLSSTAPAESSVGVTVSTTSAAFDISKRQQIVVQFLAQGIGSGNGVFNLDGSNDGTNWVSNIAVQDLTSTASTTYVTSKTLSVNGSQAVKVESGFRFIRAVVVVTTDGTYSAFMEAGG